MKYITEKSSLGTNDIITLFPFLEKYEGTKKVKVINPDPKNLSLIEYAKRYNVVIILYFGDYHYSFFDTLKEFDTKSQGTAKLIVVSTIQKSSEVENLSSITWIEMPTMYAFLSKNCKYIDILNPPIKKHFITLLNRPCWYRQELFLYFYKFNLLDKGYLSYLFENRWKLNPKQIFNDINKFISSDIPESLNLDEIYKLLPYKNFIESSATPGLNFLTLQDFYNQSALSIELETYVENHHNWNPGFTEKTIRPLMFGTPFLLYGPTGSLQTLKTLGFETYSDIFDENYDTIENHQKRLKMIINEVERLSKLSLNEITALRNSVRDISEHNQNHALLTLPEQFKIASEKLETYIESLL